jgi:hypothetical protein
MHVIKKKHHYKRKRSTHIHMQVGRRIGEDREKEKEKKESRIGEERETAGSPSSRIRCRHPLGSPTTEYRAHTRLAPAPTARVPSTPQ